VRIIPAEQEQVGGRQHGDGDAGVGEPPGSGIEGVRRERRELRRVADRDPAAAAVFLGEAGDLLEMHPGGIEVEVEMEIDVDIEPVGDREDVRDLAVGIAVEIRSAADQVGTAGARRDQQLFGAGIVEKPFLGKDADLQIDRPGVIRLEAADGVESLEADARVDLDMVRMWVVPWTIARSSVRRARA